MFDVLWFVVLLSSMYVGLKLLCNEHDRLRKERDDLWDRNGWARPNRKNHEVRNHKND